MIGLSDSDAAVADGQGLKTRKVTFLVSESEFKEIDDAAYRQRVTLSAYVRTHLLGKRFLDAERARVARAVRDLLDVIERSYPDDDEVVAAAQAVLQSLGK